MFERLADALHSIASDAYTTLKSTIERSGAGPTTNTTSSIDVDAAEIFPSPPKRKAESMSQKRPQNTGSIARFLNGFEAEEEERKRKDPGQRSECDISTSPASSLQRTTGRGMPPISERSDERRALGIPEKLPADAISIPDPMRKQSFVLKGRLQPHNSLEDRASSFSQYFEHRTSNKRPPQPITTTVHRVESTGQKSDGLHENNHNRPNKKLKHDQSPTVKGSSQSYAIDIDDSQNGMGSKNILRSPEVILVSDIQTGQKRVKQRTSSRATLEEFRSRAEPDLSSIHDKRRPSVLTSDRNVDFSAAERSNEMLDEGNFMKKARRQRVEKDSDDLVDNDLNNVGYEKKKKLDAMLPDSSPPHSASVSAASRPRQGRTLARPNSTSRMAQRFRAGEESPDALQGDVTTIIRPRVSSSKSQQSEQTTDKYTSTNTARRKAEKRNSASSAPAQFQRVFPVQDHTFFDNDILGLAFNDDHTRFDLILRKPMLGQDPVYTVSISSINKIFVSEGEESTKLKLGTRNVGSARPNLFYEFASHKDRSDAIELFHILTGVKIEKRPEEWMTRAFSRGAAAYKEFIKIQEKQARESKRPPPTSRTPAATSYVPTERAGVKRARLTDNLDNPQRMTVISGADRSGLRRDSVAYGSKHDENLSTKVVLTDTPSANQTASTRSTRSRSNKVDDLYDPKFDRAADRESEFYKLQKWKKPLIYPLTGKKRETVQFDDLQRLDDDEFLNDNLVSLFIRYLEEHADATQRKRIHFFNSFLFEALTKDAKTRRGINFDSVRKWTSKYDLFSRDFVVVPVNENLHWFVMIICNLSYFRTLHCPKSEDEDESNDATTTTHPSVENTSTTILQSDLEGPLEASTRGSFAEMTLDDQDIPVPNSQATKSGYGNRGRKKPRKSLQKYDVGKPVIITLDSLDQSRSSTASVLRQYIVEEAKDKKGWDIDGNDIKGMTAKGIPHQNNFSDCGLYLCMYLEQFILDPYMFVRRILQRTSGAGWPDEIESSELRRRLRELLLKLHDQQYNQSSDVVLPHLGSILVDMGHPDQDPCKTTATDSVNGGKGDTFYNVDEEEIKRSHRTNLCEAQGATAIDSVADWQRTVNNPIEIEDDSQSTQISSINSKSLTKSPYFSEPMIINENTEKSFQTDAYGDPLVLARHLRREREGGHEQRDDTRSAARSGSASTDYLISGEGYEVDEPASTENPELPTPFPTPLETSKRRARDKFKRRDMRRAENRMDIEDEDFEGFSDSGPASQFTRVGEARPGKESIRHGNMPRRKVLQRLDENDVDILEVDDGSHDNTVMLV